MLAAESREAPQHIGSLCLYTMPEGVDEQAFLKEFVGSLRDVDKFLSPFGDRLKTGRLGMAGSVYWEPDTAIDVGYHIRHSALPKPGRYRELFRLISRLHGTLLDRSRPLWEMHVIEGLQNRQFAVYQKVHHAAMDGGRGTHVLRSQLSSDPNEKFKGSPLSQANWERYSKGLPQQSRAKGGQKPQRSTVEFLSDSFESGVSYFNALKRFGQSWADSSDPLSLPFKKVPSSSINTDIDGARRFVAQSWPFGRIRAVGKAFDGTFNDAALAMCSGALRHYLQRHASLPDNSLKAMVPVSVRQKGDFETSNAIAMSSANLATDVADPAKRIAAIQASTQAGKDFYSELTSKETVVFSTAMQMPAILMGPLGLASKVPAFNTIISNVPGYRETMYANGARVDGIYPVSMLTNGVALNFTLHTYDKNVDFGIIACRRSVPQVQRIIDYMEEALVELEEAAGIIKAKPKQRQTKVAKTKPKTKKVTKATAKRKTKASKVKPKAIVTKAKPSTKVATKSTTRATTAKRKTRRKTKRVKKVSAAAK